MIDQLTFFDDDHKLVRQARSDIRLGDAAEAFVIAKLLKAGFDAHGVRRDAPYDIGVDLGSGRYCRIQVKGRARAHRGKWEFRFVRGNPRTGAGTYAYTDTDFDITACVALSLERVVFFPGVQASIRLSTTDFLRPESETESWTRALHTFNCKQ
jgi:PD-(D/E)XK endonuclease